MVDKEREVYERKRSIKSPVVEDDLNRRVSFGKVESIEPTPIENEKDYEEKAAELTQFVLEKSISNELEHSRKSSRPSTAESRLESAQRNATPLQSENSEISNATEPTDLIQPVNIKTSDENASTMPAEISPPGPTELNASSDDSNGKQAAVNNQTEEESKKIKIHMDSEAILKSTKNSELSPSLTDTTIPQLNDSAKPLSAQQPNSTSVRESSTNKESATGESDGDENTAINDQTDVQKESNISFNQESKTGQKSKAVDKTERGF